MVELNTFNQIRRQGRFLRPAIAAVLALAGCAGEEPHAPRPDDVVVQADHQPQLESAIALASRGFSARLQAIGSELDDLLGYMPEDSDGRRLFASASDANRHLLQLQERWTRVQAESDIYARSQFIETALPELDTLSSEISQIRRQLLNLYLARD